MQTVDPEEWPAEEATEPEGAQFLASSPYALRSIDLDAAGSSVWDLRTPRGACSGEQGTAVFTSSRATCLEATQVSAIADPSLFEDVTEPAALATALTVAEHSVLFE